MISKNEQQKQQPFQMGSIKQGLALIESIQQEILSLTASTNLGKQTQERIRILQERLRLLSSIKDYTKVRLDNLQRILKHYSTNIFKPTQKYDFQKIKYINEHLTMDRFFAFIKDFNLNDSIRDIEAKNMLQPKKIALLFKKCSSNAIYLDLPEFISLLERLFVQLFDANQNHAKYQKLQKIQRERKRALAKLRQQIKQQKNRLKYNTQSPASPKNTKSKKKQKQKIEKTQRKQPLKQQILTEQQYKIDMEKGLYCFTNEQKIEFYMLHIGIDNKKEIQKKLRSFTKSDYKYQQLHPKSQNQHSLPQPKAQLLSVHKEWRKEKKMFEQSNVEKFMDVLVHMSERSKIKSRSILQRSLPKQYEKKKKQDYQKFIGRQLNLIPYYLKKQPFEDKNNNQYSLQMLHQSSPNQLPIDKIYPQRYNFQDPTDQIYMKHFAITQNAKNRKPSVQESTKQRARQLQNQQAEKMKRLANSLIFNNKKPTIRNRL